MHALPVDNDEIAKHAKIFFSLLQHSDYIIKQEALKIVMKHFKSISLMCHVTDFLKLIDCTLALEEHFPEEFLRVEVNPLTLECFSESLTPLHKTIAISYLISILKEPNEKNIVLHKTAAVRMLQIVCIALDNETIVHNQLLDLLNYVKPNYSAIHLAVSTGILSLPALVKAQPRLSNALLKTYRKHLMSFFIRLNAVTDDGSINELYYDFELFYDSNSLKQILSSFAVSLQQKKSSLHELHQWRMLLIKILLSTPSNKLIIDNIFTLLKILHYFEHDRDKEEYARALLQYIKQCDKLVYRLAATEQLALVISLFKPNMAISFLYKTVLTENFIEQPEIPIAISACLKCLVITDIKSHLAHTLNNITKQQILISTQKLSLCLEVLREFPALLTIEIIKTYLEPYLSALQQQYAKLAYRVLNINACDTRQSTRGIKFFPSATIISTNATRDQKETNKNITAPSTTSLSTKRP